MRKKDYWLFATIVFGLIIAGGIPRLLIALGFASDHLSTYTADENGILYLAANRQIRIIDREGHETRFIAPFAATSICNLNKNTLLLIKDNRSVQIRKDGTILSMETETDGISDTDNIARPLMIGNSIYSFHLPFGRYCIQEKSQDETTIRYRMPVFDYLVLLYEILFFISVFPACAFLPIYYYKTGRMAKDGTILPPQRVGH